MSSLTYKNAGVDIKKGNKLIERIKPIAQSTMRKEVLNSLGGFGALFELPLDKYKNPVLVAGTDGVGTKLKLAGMLKKHDTIGIDLVAMCVNDLIVQGAEPLFFLDYYATGSLNNDIAESVIKGIAYGCKQSGCALIGGETAEMPQMYNKEEYDLAGFCVGIVEKKEIIDGSNVNPKDHVIALASSGAHSNGYSLIRKILQTKKYNQSHINALLEPTKIYVKTILSLITKYQIKAISHITGGGILENIPRVIANNLSVKIDTQSWQMPDIFKWLKDQGNIDKEEMFRVFNCGVGMVVIVAKDESDKVIKTLNNMGENAWLIGEVFESDNNMVVI